MLYSAGIRHYAKQQKNLEVDKEKEVWRESEEEEEAEWSVKSMMNIAH